MPTADHKDLIGGVLLIGIGVSATVYAASTLSLGSLSQLGPGMAPVALGVILASMGLGIVITAFGRSGSLPPFDFRSFAAIGAGIFTFGVLLGPFGLVPAIFGLTAVASRANSKLSWLGVGAVAAVLSLSAILIFKIGLGLQVPLATWPL